MMVEHNSALLASWEGEKKWNLPVFNTLPLCHENPNSLREEKLNQEYSATGSVTQRCKWVFSTLKIQESREKQGYKDFQHLDPLSSHLSWLEQGANDAKVRV